MIEAVEAIEFVKAAKNGRTRPLLLSCERYNAQIVEVFCKFSSGCDQGVINLAREMIGVCLAADLNLPVTTPHFVHISSDFIASIKNDEFSNLISESAPVAFGSVKAPPQFSTWPNSARVSGEMLSLATAVFVFDVIIQNPDRRIDNANCLVKGSQLRLIDHELAFSHGVVLGWTPPWQLGGAPSAINHHIFMKALQSKELNFSPVAAAWRQLSDERLAEYASILPPDWIGAQGAVNEAIELIADARENIDGCIMEIQRVLA